MSVFYFTSTNSRIAKISMRAGYLGFIATPKNTGRIPLGVTWCLDNGCYAASAATAHRPRPQDQRHGGRPLPDQAAPPAWDEQGWLDALAKLDPANCAFAVAPDVVHDAQATLERAFHWLPHIRRLGYPAAYAAQDGATPAQLPWDALDALFLGGSDTFKLGEPARALVREARKRGKLVHMGRVNSYKRMRYAEAIGCHTADGTQLGFRPSQTFPQVIGWYHTMRSQEALFDLTDAEHGES